ncbi:MAG: polymer-forming cytoskeletal protein [Chloroherpetonaceae bacterium]|nr:polymer-forming cytoskeletal protein [Chloroherpetonaceae bacterium]
MFGKKNHEPTPTDKLSILSEGTICRGDLETTGNIRIDGKIIGNIVSIGNVAIGKGGIVEGNISAKNIKVSGRITGNLNSAEHLILDSTSTVQGDMTTKLLAIEDGAQLNGKVSMQIKMPHPSELPPGKEAEKLAKLDVTA